jgi:hypothetical protein
MLDTVVGIPLISAIMGPLFLCSYFNRFRAMGHKAPYHTNYNKYLTKNLLAYYDKNIAFFFGGMGGLP